MDLNEVNRIIKLLEEKEYDKLIGELNKKRNKLESKKEYRESKKKKTSTTPSKYNFIISDKSKEVAEEYRNNLINNQTEAEKRVKVYLNINNIKFVFQKIFFYKNKDNFTKFFITDFYLPEYNIVVEIDGGYHTISEQKKDDRDRTKILKEFGRIKKVIRFTNEDTEHTEYFINKLKRQL